MLRYLFLSIFACLAGCSTAFETPRNLTKSGDGYQAERQRMNIRDEYGHFSTAKFQNAGRCQDMDLALAPTPDLVSVRASHEHLTSLSPGDLIRVEIVQGKGFEGDYIVAANGYLRLPHMRDIPAAGFTLSDLEHALSRLLIEGGFFQPNFAQVSVSVLQWAPIQVQISGAVFSAGDVVLNERQASDDRQERLDAPGDFTVRRSLSAALFAAAGVRPDADIRNIILIRQGQRKILNMTGALDGGPLYDPILVAGDRIHVPSRGCFQLALARPSRITPPGVRVFMSNLTRPAASNGASAIGQNATSLPYGTRLLQGLVSANCVGGTQATNAERWGVLVSRNPITGQSEVIAREIEQLVRRADRDDFNPVLLPGDAIACYDSHYTNVRDIIATLSESVFPITNTLALGRQAK